MAAVWLQMFDHEWFPENKIHLSSVLQPLVQFTVQAAELIKLSSENWESRADYTAVREHSPNPTNITVFPAEPGCPAIHWVHVPRL